ncbi:MAG: hypothetical protein JST42_15855 [Bacteroidetes bacterium]|nr:hypothetical protein [Bacteroidota bacterium]
MKPNVVQVISPSVSSPLTSLPASAKIVRHPRSKKSKEDQAPMAPPPSEEIIQRLNAMAKQYPFCVSHRTNSHSRLL